MKEDKDIIKIFLSITICIIAFIFLFRFAKGCQSVSKMQQDRLYAAIDYY